MVTFGIREGKLVRFPFVRFEGHGRDHVVGPILKDVDILTLARPLAHGILKVLLPHRDIGLARLGCGGGLTVSLVVASLVSSTNASKGHILIRAVALDFRYTFKYAGLGAEKRLYFGIQIVVDMFSQIKRGEAGIPQNGYHRRIVAIEAYRVSRDE